MPLETALYSATSVDWQTGRRVRQPYAKPLSRVRQGIAAEVAIDRNAAEGVELESLVEIERVVEEIIRTSSLISQALVEGRTGNASDELNRLRSTGIAGHFSSLIIAAIEEQKREVQSADQVAIELARYITNLLPVLMDHSGDHHVAGHIPVLSQPHPLRACLA